MSNLFEWLLDSNGSKQDAPVVKGLNISNRLRTYFVFPAGGYLPFPNTFGYAEYDGTDYSASRNEVANQELENGSSSENAVEWHIEGAIFGIRYLAIPHLKSPWPPLCIYVSIPDQTEWPSQLWDPLNARDSVHLHGKEVANLGISKHLCKALNHWASKMEDFERKYTSMPFGSSIRVLEITADVKDMVIRFVPNNDLTSDTLSVKHLQDMWKLEDIQWPPSIDIKKLIFKKNLSADVTLVSLEEHSQTDQPLVFKSGRARFSATYHEIKMLLTLASSKYTVGPPAYLVTMYDEDKNENLVLGFLMEYHPGGNLQNMLPMRRKEGSLKPEQQVRWALNITSALSHIISDPGRFYSDLRMDNMLVTNQDPETVILIDFEQSRNLHNWAPPEIYYTEWIAELGHPSYERSGLLNSATMSKYSRILKQILTTRKYPLPLKPRPRVYNNPPYGWYFPWLLSTQQEKEAGEVYLLGKALWCIFEGRGSTDVIMGRSTPEENEQRFPEFRLTPAPMRSLIRDCTRGAREWTDGPLGIYRRAGKIFPLGKTGLNGEEEASLNETRQAIGDVWRGEMAKAEAFVLARERHDRGVATDDDMALLHYLRRPSLSAVRERLEEFESSLINPQSLESDKS